MHEHTSRDKDSMAFDLVIVGSGASASFTLLHYLERLEGLRSRVSIAVIEKSGDFHGGIAYGKRSGEHALTITTLADFLPPEELDAFTRWIDDRDELPSSISPAQIAAIDTNEPDAVSMQQQCIPRRLFGRYLAKRVEVAIADAERLGDATVNLIQSEVLDIQERAGDGYTLICRQAGEGAATRTIAASQVVLCLGSPPTSHLGLEGGSTVSGTGERIIDDLYEGDYDDRLHEITARLAAATLEDGSRPRVLVVGSNASAMELLYSLHERHVNAGLDVQITVVSRMGTLPELSQARQGDQQDALFEEWMKRLKSEPHLSAEYLFESARTMMAEARAEGQPLVAYNGVVNRLLAAALASMSPQETHLFITRYANLLGRYKRLAEKEYVNAAAALQHAGLLDVIKGTVESMQETIRWRVGVTEKRRRGPHRRVRLCVQLQWFRSAGPELLHTPDQEPARSSSGGNRAGTDWLPGGRAVPGQQRSLCHGATAVREYHQWTTGLAHGALRSDHSFFQNVGRCAG